MPERYVNKVRSGDKEAFRFIVREYKDSAYSLAVSITKDEFAAKDVVQNAFVQAYTKLKTFIGQSSFKTWFYRIVVNEAFQVIRKQNQQKKIAAAVKNEPQNISTNNTGKKTDEDYLRFYIRETIQKLTPDEALALHLFYLEEYSIKEAVQVTGWSESKTKVLLHRARKNFKQILTEEYHLQLNDLLEQTHE